ncbi:hypothetical protein TWF102_000204 [Orbilia oligospora]|uniref:Uncharacterized protein n=1 Tax=Orbilia oligospora TaxID=2813651 RepID=A0A7C8JWN5_ORBOL|nr:hypothetical protein TWF102_000204 [Orbilia oligospora]KAF3115304.1 hypothetical protein TWF103_011562 [Orbilia oligospora]KAF3116803.1 hypothetical protein TWF706_000028 [Orbilia oligospora]KAF3147226.1 hypothetical protein TWF703_000066 [Orbilia oligospora]
MSAPPPPPPPLSLVRPTVPKPALTAKKDPNVKPKKQNLNTTLIREAFNDQYWLERTGNWSQIFPLENVLTLIQKICDKVYDHLGDQMSPDFGYRRQSGQVKAAMYGKFFNLLDENKVDPMYHPIIIEMLEATYLGNDVQGCQWLFEYCMIRTWENRMLRAKTKNPQMKKRHRGVAYFHSGSLESRDAPSNQAASSSRPIDF